MTDPSTPGLLGRIPPPRKIALLRASRIGDFICATPAFAALRRAVPDAEITLIGLPFVEDLVARSPHLNRFLPFPGFPGMAEQFFAADIAGDFIHAVQAERFDLAIQMHGSGANSNPFALMLGASATAGFIRRGDPPGRLTAAFPYPRQAHEIDRLLALVGFLGAEPGTDRTVFPIWAEDESGAAALLDGAAPPLIGIHAGTWDATKRWQPERFATVARRLQSLTGGTVVLLGSADGMSTSYAIASSAGMRHRDLTGRTTLGALGAVIRHLSVLITNDSGPAHIAYALGTPCVTIFGGTSPAQWGPRSGPHRPVAHDVPCRPCEITRCPIGYVCLERVDPDTVVTAAIQIMEGTHANV